MQYLGLSATANTVNKWKTGLIVPQLTNQATEGQIFFDVIFGIVLPLLCFAFDPILFTGDSFYGPESIYYKAFAYIFSGLSITGLALFLIAGKRAGRLAGVFSGVFVAGALVSFILGLIILPYTLIGLFFIIGIFGFIPFFTAFVYLRNSLRALSVARKFLPEAKLASLFMCGALLIVSVSGFANYKINQTVERSMIVLLREGASVDEMLTATYNLQYLRWFCDTKVIIRAYRETEEFKHKGMLGQAYNIITGKDIEFAYPD